MAQYTNLKTIIRTAQVLTDSKAQTKKGAWKALRAKHLPKFYGLGLRKKSSVWDLPDYNFISRRSIPGNGLAAGDPNLIPVRDAYYQAHWRKRADRGAEKILRDLGLKTRWENIIAGGSDPWEKALVKKQPALMRDGYNALYLPSPEILQNLNRIEKDFLSSIPSPLIPAIKCINDIERQGFDEHGGWSQYAEFDKKGRGSAVNVDIYGTDQAENLHVIQVRMFERRHKNGYGNVKKTYFLIGYNENGNPFAHPVSAHTIHAAIKKDPSPESPVKAAQAWIWGIKPEQLDTVLRNGDVAMIPVKSAPKKGIETKSGMMQVIDTHYVYSKEIHVNGNIWAINPTLRHLKGQHPTVKGKGWYKIVIGTRASHHSFAKPTID